MASRIDKLRDLFLLVFFLLVILTIFTPLFIRSGFSVFPEEILESILLLVQISVGWKIFRLYEKTVKHREEEIQNLEARYQQREKELLEAFAYLGKVNVQVSLIRSFLQKLKAPSSRREAEDFVGEILDVTLSLSGKPWVTLRAIDTTTLQTVNERWAKTQPDMKTSGIRIGNKDIVNWERNGKRSVGREYCIYGSSGSELSPLKTYLIFENGGEMEPGIEDFFRAAVNQYEVLLVIFSLKEKGG